MSGSENPPPATDSIAGPLLVLLGLTLVSQLAGLAYNSEHRFQEVWLFSVVVLCAMTLPLAALGLWLGRGLGLGAPLISGLLAGRPGSGPRFLREARLAVALGLTLGAFLLLLRIIIAPVLPPELPALGHRGAVGGLLASVGAAIAEEVWLRLGVMTLLAWVIARLRGQSFLAPATAWWAIVVAALLFGAIHLPQLAAAGAANPAGIVGTMFGNALVGVVCGWLFWKRSLVAAMLVHFAVDVVLHVLPAFFL